LEKCCRQMVLDAYKSWKAGMLDLLLWWSWFLKFLKDIIEFVTETFHIVLAEFLAAVMVPCLAWITFNAIFGTVYPAISTRPEGWPLGILDFSLRHDD
jgi:hypothetical protein